MSIIVTRYLIILRMQPAHFLRLSQSVRTFVEEVETSSGLSIEVVADTELNTGGPVGRGKLKVNIEARRVRLHVPTNGYFPDGGVRHEILHVNRLLVEGVPRLALAELVDWAPEFERDLVRVDNALEHLVIVPIELQHHPERRAHWDAVMEKVWTVDIAVTPSELNRRIGACLHWTFLRHVLQESETVDAAITLLNLHNLRAEADSFYDKVVPKLDDKLSVVKIFFDWFPEVTRNRAAIEYLNISTGSILSPIPS